MSLFDYTRADVESDIRAVMRAAGYTELSARGCKLWARAFVQSLVPRWSPGKPLTVEQAQRVGAAFEELVARARGRGSVRHPR